MAKTTTVALACLISGRNLGDAAAHSSVLSHLAARQFAGSYLVWTKPSMAFLFESIPGCEVITSPFPMGTPRQFGAADALSLLQAARAIRGRKPQLTMDLVGDFRERLLAMLAGSGRHVHLGWAAGHPFADLIRNPFGPGRPVVTIPIDRPNVYDAYEQFVDQLCPPKTHEIISQSTWRQSITQSPLHVGLHPFASQESKLWPSAAWMELADRLLASGTRLTAFCAPSEVSQLRVIFANRMNRIEEVAGSLRQFESAVAALDLMIGLDSFSVHMAQRQGIRSIMLNAGNPPALWAPSNGTVLGSGGGCAHHPCYNVPKCKKGAKYVCIRSLQVDDVMTAIDAMAQRSLHRSNLSAQMELTA